MRRCLPVLTALCLAAATAASAASDKPISWARPQIARVVQAGFMAPSVSSFRPQDPLTESALAELVSGLDERLTQSLPPLPPLTAATSDEPPPGGQPVPAAPPMPGEPAVPELPPIGSEPPPVGSDPPPVGSDPPIGEPLPAAGPPWPLLHWHATSPAGSVTVDGFDRVLVRALGLSGAAQAIRAELARAGLHPTARAGTETIARLIGLRVNHPAAEDELELLPSQPITRAEAAYSLDRTLTFDKATHDQVEQLAASFRLPEPTDWQRRILETAVSYVGYPYVWGGTSPGPEAPAGVAAPGGFDCSGFVWRVYKLTSYAGERGLAGVLRGRTTFELSGEVGRSERIYKTQSLEPGDVLFFGRGPDSKPAQVDHAAIYLGDDWIVQSSGAGVTIVPFDGWYVQNFAWARRPLREAGLER